jgi:L-alanine-DL-glutamate epimerase-like enolase superfamily enzyme
MEASGVIGKVDVALKTIRFDKPIGGSGVMGVDIIVAQVTDDRGVTGLGFSYVIGGGAGEFIVALCRQQADTFLIGKPLQAPADHWAQICRSFNRTGYGPNFIALAALDVALWDLTARRQKQPLALTLGGALTPVPLYASGGFSPQATPAESAELARRYLGEGYCGVKPRVNAKADDRAVLETVRTAIGPQAMLMADANEKGRSDTAPGLLALAAELGLAFIEEPLPADDPLGFRALGKLPQRAPIAAGEHLQGPAAFATAIEDGYLSYIQPDLAFAGGLTPCLQVARHAAQRGIVVAPHFLPGFFVHLSDAFGGKLLVEEFPLIEPAFDGWPQRHADGTLAPRDVPGHGLTLKA